MGKFRIALASVDPLEKNIEFAKATSVDLGGTRGVVEKKEADFPILSDPTKATATAYGVLGQSGMARTAGPSTSARTARDPRGREGPSKPRRRPRTQAALNSAN